MAEHLEYIELISAALDGALSQEEQAKLELHLAFCPECKALMEEMKAIHEAMADLPPAEVPPELYDNIMAAVAADNVTPLVPKKSSFRWQKWAASAAVLALVIAGAWGVRDSLIGSKNIGEATDAPAAAEGVSDSGLSTAAKTQADSDQDAALPETAALTEDNGLLTGVGGAENAAGDPEPGVSGRRAPMVARSAPLPAPEVPAPSEEPAAPADIRPAAASISPAIAPYSDRSGEAPETGTDTTTTSVTLDPAACQFFSGVPGAEAVVSPQATEAVPSEQAVLKSSCLSAAPIPRFYSEDNPILSLPPLEEPEETPEPVYGELEPLETADAPVWAWGGGEGCGQGGGLETADAPTLSWGFNESGEAPEEEETEIIPFRGNVTYTSGGVTLSNSDAPYWTQRRTYSHVNGVPAKDDGSAVTAQEAMGLMADFTNLVGTLDSDFTEDDGLLQCENTLPRHRLAGTPVNTITYQRQTKIGSHLFTLSSSDSGEAAWYSVSWDGSTVERIETPDPESKE